MPWFKVDDQLHSHKKAIKAGVDAMGLWLLAGSWAASHLTDGFVPDYVIARLAPGADGLAQRLVDAGLWLEDHEDGEDGWRFHEWEERNPTAEEVEAKRGISRRRWAMNNNPELRKAVRERDGNGCRYCAKNVNWSDRRSPDGGTYDHVIPMSKGGDESVENIVVCCRECNGKKGARTPDEAGMPLLPPKSHLDTTQKESRSRPDSSVPPDPSRPNPSRPTEPSVPTSDLRPDQWATDDTDVETVRATANTVAKLIGDNGHPMPSKGTKAAETWLVEMDRLLRLGPPGQTTTDPPTPDQVVEVARWATSDSFWAANVQSIPKLREKWSQLALKARDGPNGRPATGLEAVVAASRRAG